MSTRNTIFSVNYEKEIQYIAFCQDVIMTFGAPRGVLKMHASGEVEPASLAALRLPLFNPLFVEHMGKAA